MAQVQSQLDVLTLQLHDMTKMKEKMDEDWCTYCKVDNHFKNQCPTLLHVVISLTLCQISTIPSFESHYEC